MPSWDPGCANAMEVHMQASRGKPPVAEACFEIGKCETHSQHPKTKSDHQRTNTRNSTTQPGETRSAVGQLPLKE